MSAIPIIALNIINKANRSKRLGASVYQRLNRKHMNDENYYSIELYEFDDNDSFSTLDAFFIQMGSCTLYLSEDYEENNTTITTSTSTQSKNQIKKFMNVIHGKDIELVYVKPSFLIRTPLSNSNTTDLASKILKLTGKSSHVTNSAEVEMPIAYGTIECLIRTQQLLDDDDNYGKFTLFYGTLTSCMRLDSAASEAVNLLPKADHPSQFGSIFGVLNRCKTKMGPRLLERWLRQPLIDITAINERLNVVELLHQSATCRHQLIEGPLKAIPDMDSIIRKMQSKKAGLEEMFRLYILSRSLPNIVLILQELVDTYDHEQKASQNNEEERGEKEGGTKEDITTNPMDKSESIRSKFINPLTKSMDKFGMYQQFIEHVLDLDALPNLEINPVHDQQLQELRNEKQELEFEAQSLLSEAQCGWASAVTISLDTDPRNKNHGIIFRSTRADDERTLRASKKDVKILSILKNGVHFTTTALETLSHRYRQVDEDYKEKQQVITSSALETAMTYLPLVESACDVTAELDVLTGFATAASHAPLGYTRPVIRPCSSATRNAVKDTATTTEDGSTVTPPVPPAMIRLKNARHPCVELMNEVTFVPNDYELIKGTSGMQIITGPNMGGKSTFIRGLGSIIVMAQVGSFVPCSEADISIVNCILARVGAGDAVQKGVSTFMAEMLEASVILNTATEDSLIIIDELGRGTSTFDGFGLAWGISEHIATRIGAYCVFATHFHELTALANYLNESDSNSSNSSNSISTSSTYDENFQMTTGTTGTSTIDTNIMNNVGIKNKKMTDTKNYYMTGVVNRHVTGKVLNGKVVMLYAVQDGPCHQSFGVHVAAMAQFPDKVIQTAKRKAIALESSGVSGSSETGSDSSAVTAAEEVIHQQRIQKDRVIKVMGRFEVLPVMTIPADRMKYHLQQCMNV